MFNPSLSALTRGILAVAALSTASFVAEATPIATSSPTPFPNGSGVTLTATGGAVAVQVGALTLHTDAFYITNFRNRHLQIISAGSTDDMGSHTVDDMRSKLTADFHVNFIEGGSVDLTGTTDNFIVHLIDRPGNFDSISGDPILGAWDAIIELATFSGFASTGDAMTVQLNPSQTTSGRISIAANPAGGFFFDTPTPFTVHGQYNVNNGAFIDTPPLGASNQPVGFNAPAPTTPSNGVPEPATLALLASGLVAMGARRRRGVAAVAA
jgi:hypothetical protein